MAVRSMTGFGRGEREEGGRVFSVEIRCVNNRYLDVKLKLPRGVQAFEERIRKLVGAVHQRGRVDLQLTINGGGVRNQRVLLNEELASSYYEAITRLSERFGLGLELTPQQLASFPDVMVREEEPEDIEALWIPVEKALREALENCDVMRQQEGGALATDLFQRLDHFADVVSIIEERIPELVLQRQSALQERLAKLLDSVALDQDRLAQEVAILADKTDVTEEIVRLHSHMEQFSSFLKEDGAIGRKLDFLIQEFLREVNTTVSKISDAGIAQHTVELKSELEKIREQVQNIE
ncbi:YicC family protein [Desulforhopalus vacuolatus]|uniref:YicC/YloC family endoribonuclease n=1 Tax=Desulforhopalus vacuolatus TaxID=40414 RepID=UPI0019649CBE|nr:YicC/YloC family endoribonuclease [Desulforhopalus vacuolatus]MBM9520139.1 YicC family protein [Desulforhopalus vacuolatus]